MNEPVYTYRITNDIFYCYVIQPDLELYSLASDKKVVQYRSGATVKNYSCINNVVNDDFLNIKFNAECLRMLKEFLNV